MKKLACAVALPVLASLLSACATPPGGGNLGASDSLTQGQKKEVGEMLEAWGARLPQNRKEVKEVVIQKKAREVLKELEGRLVEGVVRVDGAAVDKGLKELVALNALMQKEVDDVKGKLPDPDKWSPVEAKKVRKDLKLVDLAGLADFKSFVELALSENESNFIRRETFRFDLKPVTQDQRKEAKKKLGEIFPKKKKEVESKYGKGIIIDSEPMNVMDEGVKKFSYFIENPAGLDRDMIDEIRKAIARIPRIGDPLSASIRWDSGPSKLEIPIHQTSDYIGIGDLIAGSGACEAEITITLKVVDAKTKDYIVLDDMGENANIFPIITGKDQATYRFSEKGPVRGGKCDLPDFSGRNHYIMITPKEGRVVAQYVKVTLENGKPLQAPMSIYSEEKPACPPGRRDGWTSDVEKALKIKVNKLSEMRGGPGSCAA